MAVADFETALDETTQIDLTATGRVSGRKTSRPVWFVRQGDTLYLLPVSGSDSQWYKNLLKTPAIGLAADRAEFSTTASPVTDHRTVGQVLDKFSAKYGASQVAEYYPDQDVAVEVALR
ncbi:MAG: nitroreductase/quinone reductase family protein [Streptosporangiaceae bacterium]